MAKAEDYGRYYYGVVFKNKDVIYLYADKYTIVEGLVCFITEDGSRSGIVSHFSIPKENVLYIYSAGIFDGSPVSVKGYTPYDE